MLTLLTGLPGKLLGSAAAVAGILLAAFLWLHSHDSAVRAEMRAEAAAAVQAAQEVSRAHEAAAIQAVSQDAQRRLQDLATIKEKTHAAVPYSGCAASPAVRALLDGLRGGTPGGPGASH